MRIRTFRSKRTKLLSEATAALTESIENSETSRATDARVSKLVAKIQERRVENHFAGSLRALFSEQGTR